MRDSVRTMSSGYGICYFWYKMIVFSHISIVVVRNYATCLLFHQNTDNLKNRSLIIANVTSDFDTKTNLDKDVTICFTETFFFSLDLAKDLKIAAKHR